MSCTLAGRGVLLSSPQLDALVAEFHRLQPAVDLGGYHGSLWNLQIPADPTPPVPEINRLVWPTGASRCATFHTLVDDDRLTDLRAAVDADTTVELAMDTATGSITTDLYLTDVKPLCQITGRTQLYLVSLADQRYFWRWKTGSVVSQPASWAALYSTLGTALGVTITAESVAAAYGVPSVRWQNLYNKNLPTLLDAAAAAVGQVVVVGLDGAVTTTGYATANTAATTNYASIRKMLGGTQTAADVGRIVPASVVVVFGKTTAGVAQADPYTVTKTLAGLSVSGYGSATGVAGMTATVYADLVYDGTNSTACNTLATQAATDWYGWQLANVDVTLPGTWEWTPTGAEDHVDWVYRSDNITTSVRQGPRQTLPRGTYDLTGDDAALEAGCGLEIDGDGNLALDATAVAGDGLTASGDCTLGVNVGCGLEISSDAVRVKASDLAGSGLGTSGTCGLTVNTGSGITVSGDNVVIDYTTINWTTFLTNLFLANAGCGLRNDGGVLKVDLEAIASDGLIGNNTDCLLSVQAGCGIFADGDGVSVDYAGLAGIRANSGLVVRADADCDSLGVDLVADHTTTETLVTDVAIEHDADVLRLTKTTRVYTNHFNAAGDLINRTVASPTTAETEIVVCDMVAGCPSDDTIYGIHGMGGMGGIVAGGFDGPDTEGYGGIVPGGLTDSELCDLGLDGPTVDSVTPTPSSGSAPLVVRFTPTVSGGVPDADGGGFTYSWTFSGGSPSVASSSDYSPSVTFSAAGTVTYTLTVTDECSNDSSEFSDTLTVSS